MQIKNGLLVTVSYRMYIDSPAGELVEETKVDDLYSFIMGDGQQLESFEKNLLGLKPGDAFSFGLSADDAFGQIDDDAVAEIPKSVFAHEGTVDESLFKMHRILPMKDEDGTEYRGIIIGIDEEFVTMDFNHPLAGENVWFDGKVIEVKAIN